MKSLHLSWFKSGIRVFCVSNFASGYCFIQLQHFPHGKKRWSYLLLNIWVCCTILATLMGGCITGKVSVITMKCLRKYKIMRRERKVKHRQVPGWHWQNFEKHQLRRLIFTLNMNSVVRPNQTPTDVQAANEELLQQRSRERSRCITFTGIASLRSGCVWWFVWKLHLNLLGCLVVCS